jgi:LssY C-terminus
MAGEAVCKGSFEVRVHRIQGTSAAVSASPTSVSSSTQAQAVVPGSSTADTPSASENSSSAGKTETQPKSRSEELKSQMATAGRIFVTGQFGTGKPDTAAPGTSSAASAGSTSPGGPGAPVLKVSDSPLDPELRKEIDGLPRRVNDQLKNLGDMVNFIIVGSEKDVQAALESANWHVADTSSQNAVLKAVLQTYEKKDYLQMPMSTLYLFGRAQDFGYEQADPIAMVASRHHFRIWKAPFTWQGHDVWVGAGTHDIGFAKDKRNGNVTHKIDPAVDAERENIGASLQKNGKAKSLNYYLPPHPIQEAKNATGDVYHSDGRVLVIFVQ